MQFKLFSIPATGDTETEEEYLFGSSNLPGRAGSKYFPVSAGSAAKHGKDTNERGGWGIAQRCPSLLSLFAWADNVRRHPRCISSGVLTFPERAQQNFPASARSAAKHGKDTNEWGGWGIAQRCPSLSACSHGLGHRCAMPQPPPCPTPMPQPPNVFLSRLQFFLLPPMLDRHLPPGLQSGNERTRISPPSELQ